MIKEAPADFKYLKQLKQAQSIANRFEREVVALLPEQIAALTTIVLISDYHGDYVDADYSYRLGKAVIDHKPNSKGFAKNPIDEVYALATSALIRMPYTFQN